MTTAPRKRPLLARRAGEYREFAPAAALREHFCCLWSHRVDAANDAPIAIVPDGYCDIVFIGGRLSVAGPDRVSAFPEIRPGETVSGVRFAPGAASSWLRLAMNEIAGLSISLEEIWGPEISGVEDHLSQLPSPAERLKALEAFLARRSEQFDIPRAPDSARELFESVRNGRLDGAYQHLDLSERQLRRMSHHAFGYSPKTLARILRFQRLLTLLSAHAPLAETAVAAGYADQAHMTREAVELSTLTPSELRLQMAQ